MKIDPEIVGVEHAELLDALEVLFVIFGNLSDFQQPQLVVVLNQCASLDISPVLNN